MEDFVMKKFDCQFPDICADYKKSYLDRGELMQAVPEELIEKLNAEFERRKNIILATESEWELGEGGFIRYISSSEGDDKNDGLTPETPWKSIQRLIDAQRDKAIRGGDVILFKRGDEWHQKLWTVAGVTYSAYGEGPKPRILGSTEADSPEQWIPTDVEGVYRFLGKFALERDVGNIVFNDGEAFAQRVLKAADKDETLPAGGDNIVGNGIKTWLMDPRPFSGYADLKKIADDIPDADFMYYHDFEAEDLYLYSRNGNPGKLFWSIEICTKGNGISATTGVTLDNLCIRYPGSHGVGAGTCKKLIVRNCEVGYIGGSIQFIRDNRIVRFGNAIEIYGMADGFYVYNNYIHQCFDCGPTAQWSGNVPEGKQLISKDIHYYDNILNEAGLEIWYSTHSEMTEDTCCKLIECNLYNNTVTGSGSGWKAYNHQKQEWCAFYGGPETNAPYIDCYMADNYFWNNKRHLMKAVPTSVNGDYGFKWVGNVIIHQLDAGSIGYMSDELETARGEKCYYYDKETIAELVERGGLGENYFFYTPGDKKDRRISLGMYR